jgi:PiT family inorganic phosphate transporter
MTTLVLISVLFLAFFNGANDNFKGVATIYGSGLASYRTALAWGTLATATGAMLAPTLAPGLIGMFKAKGLVPDAIAAAPDFMSAAVLAAAATVAVATRVGMPVSTTHALTGGLVGAGVVAAGSDLNAGMLGKAFVLPLLAGPFVAAILAAVAALLSGLAASWMKWSRIEADEVARLEAEAKAQIDEAKRELDAELGKDAPAASGVKPKKAPVRKGDRVLAVFHFLSAGAVSFARGVNDAPKLMALGFAAGALGGGVTFSVGVVTVAMTIGGLVMSRRVAETMSTKISQIEPGTGVIANTTAAVLVILGSVYKLPLSTTHVTTGGIVGVGATKGNVVWSVIGKIAIAWVTTLPTAVAFGAVLYLVISRF